MNADKNRLDFKDIDPDKGTATGYIVMYISKNIDGSDLDKTDDNDDPITNAKRIGAWASCYGIRQFQQIGGVSITAWRELRRAKETLTVSDKAEAARKAADSSGFSEFTQLMGGVFCKRDSSYCARITI